MLTSPSPGPFTAASTISLNGTADPRKTPADPFPFKTVAPLTLTFTATSYAADGTTPMATVDVGALVETDSPYLAPVPHRGRPNRPALVPLVGTALATVKGVDVEQVAATTTATAVAVLRLAPADAPG